MDIDRKKGQSNFLSNLFKSPSEKTELSKLLLSVPPFRELNQKDIEQMINIMHDRVYAQNEFIFYQGDPSIAIYIVFDGEIELISSKDGSSNKATITVAKYHKGDLFGEMAFLEDEKRFASAIAVNDCKLLVIFKPDLDEFVDKYPKKGLKILKGISQIFALRLRKLNQEYINLYFKKNSELEVIHGVPD